MKVLDLQAIVETLAMACTRYGRKNLRILYDALSTLAELMGSELAEPSLLRIFMPPLLAKWQSLGDTDRDLLPLLECFTALTTALGVQPPHAPGPKCMLDQLAWAVCRHVTIRCAAYACTCSRMYA